MRFHRVIGAEHPPHHLAGQRHRHRRGVGDDLGGNGVCRRQQVVGFVNAAHEPGGEKLVRGEQTAGVGPLGGGLNADEPGQEPRRGGLGNDPTTGEDEADLGLGRDQADVHRQGHRDTDADGWAVDRGDHRLDALVDAQRDQTSTVAGHAGHRCLDVASTLGERLATARQVGAGAKAPASTGHDDGPDIVVGVGMIEGVDQFVHHPIGEGVELIGAIQGDRRHAVGHLVGDIGIRHSDVLPRRARRRGTWWRRCRRRARRRGRRRRG